MSGKLLDYRLILGRMSSMLHGMKLEKMLSSGRAIMEQGLQRQMLV